MSASDGGLDFGTELALTYEYVGGKLINDRTYVWSLDFGETKSDARHFVNRHVNVL